MENHLKESDAACRHSRRPERPLLAPHAQIRSQIVPRPSPVPPEASNATDSPTTQPEKPARAKRWAELLARVFGFDLKRCPDYGGPLKIIVAILEPAAVRTILTYLGLPDKPPELAPAQIPEQIPFA